MRSVEKIDPNDSDDYRNYYVSNASSTTMPRLYTESYSNGNNRVSDAFVEDGSYLRLQNVSLSYTLPKEVDRAYLPVECQAVYEYPKPLHHNQIRRI